MRLSSLAALLVLSGLIWGPARPVVAGEALGDLRLPPGFLIEIYADVPGARSLAVAAELDTVFVGTRGSRIYAIRDPGLDGAATTVEVFASSVKVPNGLAWTGRHLLVAGQARIVRYALPPIPANSAPIRQVIFDKLPDRRWHGWRYAALGPDGWLYVSVGAPCNVCWVRDYEGTIIRLSPDRATRPQIVARGVRNSVGFDFHPVTGDLFFTDNGADMMGDDRPPDELNRIAKDQLGRTAPHFGYPYFGGGDARTDKFADQTPSEPTQGPEIAFDAHVAALGVHFYRGGNFPTSYRNDALVAQHGSWNRTIPDGYRVVRVTFDEDHRATGYRPFIEGWLSARGVSGRPVDIAELPDGSVLISDDKAGRVYRVRYQAP